MGNAILLIDLLAKLAVHFTNGMAVLRQAQSEGRDVTDEELAAASAAYDTKKAAILDRLDAEDAADAPNPDNG
jgi:hypothetical protein